MTPRQSPQNCTPGRGEKAGPIVTYSSPAPIPLSTSLASFPYPAAGSCCCCCFFFGLFYSCRFPSGADEHKRETKQSRNTANAPSAALGPGSQANRISRGRHGPGAARLVCRECTVGSLGRTFASKAGQSQNEGTAALKEAAPQSSRLKNKKRIILQLKETSKGKMKSCAAAKWASCPTEGNLASVRGFH